MLKSRQNAKTRRAPLSDLDIFHVSCDHEFPFIDGLEWKVGEYSGK